MLTTCYRYTLRTLGMPLMSSMLRGLSMSRLLSGPKCGGFTSV